MQIMFFIPNINIFEIKIIKPIMNRVFKYKSKIIFLKHELIQIFIILKIF